MTFSRWQLLKPFVATPCSLNDPQCLWACVDLHIVPFWQIVCLYVFPVWVGIILKKDKVPIVVEVDLGCEKRGYTKHGYLDVKLFKMGQCILLNMSPFNFTYNMPEWLISSFFPRTGQFMDRTWNTKDTIR